MGDFSSSEIFCNGASDEGFGLRYRGVKSLEVDSRHASFIYSDETGLKAAIEYVSDGNGNEAIPVFVTKAGNKVYIPPSIADLLRDKPPDHVSGGSECEDEESSGDRCTSLVRIEGISDGEYDSDSYDSDETERIGRRRTKKPLGGDNSNESDEELGGIQVVPCKMKKARRRVVNDCDDDDDFFNIAWLSDFWEQFKYVGPRLVPFLKTLGLYFVMFIPEDRPSLFAMMIKCLPIISLALFIILHGIGLSEQHKFSRRILTGLMFSCLGDAFLIWPSYFLHGMAAFGVAQYFYIRAFGFTPINWKLGLAMYTLTSSSLLLILPGLMSDALPIMIGVLVYSLLLTTMLWRAIDRVELFSEEGSWSWSKLSSCIGGIFFAISDTILALNQFYTRIPYHQTLVMTTYYFAQLGIALSVVTTTKEKTPKLETTSTDLAGAPETSELSSPSKESLRLRKGKSVI